MNILGDFKDYYVNWCKEHNRPLKDSEIINKDWKLAWSEFLEKELTPKLKEVRDEYLKMELLTRRAQQNRVNNAPSSEIEEDSALDSPSDWEVVANILKQD